MQLKTINMPRQARKTSGTGIYHVMLRGINRQDIIENRSESPDLKEYYNKVIKEHGWE